MAKTKAEALETFARGENFHAASLLGCHPMRSGFVFRVWAPRALGVSVVGDFNFWNSEDLPMKPIGFGVWEAYSAFAREGQAYKFCVTRPDGTAVYKSDPYAFAYCPLPDTSSRICRLDGYRWGDGAFRRRVAARQPLLHPMNIYEVHLGSWKRHEDGSFYTYTELAQELPAYCAQMGYTHLELMPVTEYPYDPSWGYQVTGYFAPTHRYGSPQEFMGFVDACHQAGLQVILDWVPAHFPKDECGLYEFDGSCCYELSDPRMNEHPDWTTRIFDFGKGEVQSFLISSAVHWLERYHIDGLRVDAVASMLYLDYNRPNYVPNRYGGRENLEAIDFLRKLNRVAFSVNKNVLMVAEESTAFPLITKPDFVGGLGFLYKWNMGWMNDLLFYMARDPLFRKWEHNKLTFQMTYAFSENYILPLSHDEVVHGKRSLIERMPGEYDEKFSNLRAFFAYQMAQPGKKLNFMGSEFAQFIEWDYRQGLDWLLLAYDRHRQMQDFVQTLNLLYRDTPALWENDLDWGGFTWCEPNDADRSMLSFVRWDRRGRGILVVCNFCPVRRELRIGLPTPCRLVPLLNTDDEAFGGSGVPLIPCHTQRISANGFEHSAVVLSPPMSVSYYRIIKRRPANRAKIVLEKDKE